MPVPDDAVRSQAETQRILVVDDDIQTVFLLKNILRGCGQVVFATSGEEALRLIRHDPPDLVLLDAAMPGMTGLQVCAAIRADTHLADLPVIFVTAHHGPDEETRALEAGAVDFIHKPVNPPVARARVRTHLALKARTDALRRLSEVDSLTRLANRRVFDRLLDVEWRRAQRLGTPLSLLLADVDHFKRYNDAHGHPAGDACLARVAQALADTVRRAGDVAARYGGEEFALILPNTDTAGARVVGQRLLEQVQALASAHGDSPVSACVTVSIGAVTRARRRGAGDPAPADSVEAVRALVARADEALYRAKSEGRARMETLAMAFDALTPHVAAAVPPAG